MTATMRRMLVIVGVVAAVILIAAFVIDRLATGPTEEASGPTATSAARAEPSANAGTLGATGEDAGPTGSGDDGQASEVLPPDTAGDGLPAPREYAPLVTLPLPANAAADGELVDGFPTAIPLVRGSTVRTSSVAADGARLQAAVDASTSSSPADVLAAFDAAFGELGLTGTAAPAVGGSVARQYVRDGTAIVVTATGGETTRYTVFANLTPAEG